MTDQWKYLLSAGLGGGFTGTWVESGDAEAVAALLGVAHRLRPAPIRSAHLV